MLTNGKSALIIGGGRGIGRAVSVRCARAGYHVVINYRANTAAAEETLRTIIDAGGSAELRRFDIVNSDETVRELGELLAVRAVEALVLCAGIRRDELLVFMQEEQWDAVLDTDLKSFYRIVRPVVKEMLLRHSGRIVVVSSTSGQAGLPGQVHYSAAKAGLIGAVKALALECAKRNVLVNAVAPGFIATDMTGDMNAADVVKRIPLGRFGTAEEVAGVVSFLLSNDAAYITGQVLSVNGGIYT
ncbi:MAG: 3-oxoacyl-ACP reductase FabG [Chitinispirillaceae bacterium]|nr:3-oxoacyl-ACP reductase FabG [Chitinispirillaceae bacterium]